MKNYSIESAAVVCGAKVDEAMKVIAVNRNLSMRQWGAVDYIKSQGYTVKFIGTDGPEHGNWNLL